MTALANYWYHCNGNTYGTWLRGDPRGFRERHHRKHVEGDYRNPPPVGQYERMHERSRALLKCPPIHLTAQQRRVATEALVDKLLRDGVKVIAVAVDDHHFHILARFSDRRPKRWVGRAKMHSSMLLSEFGLKGQVWARGSRALPIRDRAHQLNTFRYIVGHRGRGAAVWTFRDAPPIPESPGQA